jgi:hypothetical protein
MAYSMITLMYHHSKAGLPQREENTSINIIEMLVELYCGAKLCSEMKYSS